MSSERPRRLRLAVTLAGVLALVLVNGGRADAATTTGTTTDPVQAAAGWLATQFEDDSHLPTPTGDHFHSSFTSNGVTSYFPSYGENADAIFGLAAAGAGKDKIATALAYLVTNADAYADLSGAQGGPYDGSVAKLAVAAQVAGISTTTATAFGTHDLIQQLKTDECTSTVPDGFNDGGFTCVQAGAAKNIFASVSESLTILAEARQGGNDAPSPAALTYFDSLQCASGGFTDDVSACAAGDEAVDDTAYAIMAMTLVPSQSTHLASAIAWLKAQQEPAGSWNSANIASTGLAAAALDGAGTSETKAQAWLAGQQTAAGSPGAGALGAFAPTTAAGTSPAVLNTAQGLTGMVAGGSLATLSGANATAGTSAFTPVATLSAASATLGSTQTVSATGFAAGEQVQAVLHSTPVTLGTVTAGANGAVTVSFVVPAAVGAGAHTVTLTGLTSGLTVSSPLTLTAAVVVAPTTTTTDADVLANTGLNGPAVTRLGGLGVLALLAGSGLMFAARRRRA